MEKKLPKKARKEILKAMVSLWYANSPTIQVVMDTVGKQTLYHLYYTLNQMDCELHDLGPEFNGQQVRATVNRVKVKTVKKHPIVVT